AGSEPVLAHGPAAQFTQRGTGRFPLDHAQQSNSTHTPKKQTNPDINTKTVKTTPTHQQAQTPTPTIRHTFCPLTRLFCLMTGTRKLL
ncbi:hypothetical protein, partial [Bifidobacterium tsurumiense]|uniref:hypothetical protein n=1 Tax=Bifidobacterium tsurumiense TaxID=356829 RepID=UPI001EE651CA